jgi:glycosyltransferase involved in cell wall biosynthesis
MSPNRGRPRYDAAFYVPWISALLVPGSGPLGGAERQMHILTRLLAARGHRVCVVAYAAPGLPASRDGVDYVARHPRIGGAGPRERAAETRAIWRALAPLDAGVFVKRIPGADTGLVALAAKAKRRPFVYSSANVVDFSYERVDPKRANAALFGLGVRLADRIVVQTQEQVELCERRFGRTPTLIRSFAEPAAATAAPAERFLWIGRLRHYKQPLRFVELARAVPEARFTMVTVPADEGLDEKVETAARDVPNLELAGPRGREELMPLVESAVAVVNTADYEGMPNVFLEGWARGIPALALTHDPDGVIAREGLGGYAEGSPERLAALAREMWASRAARDGVAARCREYVAREHAPAVVAGRWAAVLGLER